MRIIFRHVPHTINLKVGQRICEELQDPDQDPHIEYIPFDSTIVRAYRLALDI